MLLAAQEGEPEVEHPRVSAFRGAQGCLCAGGGDGECWTTALGWAAWDQEVQLRSHLGISSVALGWWLF